MQLAYIDDVDHSPPSQPDNLTDIADFVNRIKYTCDDFGLPRLMTVRATRTLLNPSVLRLLYSLTGTYSINSVNLSSSTLTSTTTNGRPSFRANIQPSSRLALVETGGKLVLGVESFGTSYSLANRYDAHSNEKQRLVTN
jgi:hypothetical protein